MSKIPDIHAAYHSKTERKCSVVVTEVVQINTRQL